MPRIRGAPRFGMPIVAPPLTGGSPRLALSRSHAAIDLAGEPIEHVLALKLQSRLADMSIAQLEQLSVTNPALLREWAIELQAERDRALAEANRLSMAIDRLILAGRRTGKTAAE